MSEKVRTKTSHNIKGDCTNYYLFIIYLKWKQNRTQSQYIQHQNTQNKTRITYEAYMIDAMQIVD